MQWTDDWITKDEEKRKWHRKFAWHPVPINIHGTRWAWLEFVERQGTYSHSYAHSGWSWKYRAIRDMTE